MKKTTEQTIRKLEIGFAIYLLISVILDIAANWFEYREVNFLWYCVISAVILAIGCLYHNKEVPSVILIISLVAQTPWILDFVLEWFGFGFGRNAVLLEYGWPIFLTSTNLHAILIPISAILVWKRGFAKKTLKYSLLYCILLLSATFLFTPPDYNINCSFGPCDEILQLDEERWEYLNYFLIHNLAFWLIMITISHFAFFQIVKWKSKRRPKRKKNEKSIYFLDKMKLTL